jgi:hypothetical protein
MESFSLHDTKVEGVEGRKLSELWQYIKNSIPTSDKSNHICVAKTNKLMVLLEIVFCECENSTIQKSSLFSEILNFITGGL